MAKKTAVVIIHGIGEQIPMETLNGFIDTVWTRDSSLVSSGKPDPNTGEPRSANASWSKPDVRNRSFELQLITTESDDAGRRIDFFEYYWAHRVTGTTWEQVRAWLFALMLRNPFTHVPKGVLAAWLLLWLLTFAFIYLTLVAGLASSSTPINPGSISFEPARGTLALAASIQSWPKWVIAAVWGVASLFLGWLLSIMVDVAGDVVRYVEARPKNIAVRQSIRENGVQLLETLMGIDEHGNAGNSQYDRIIVVGHSLGTIVAYDILTHAFGRHNTRLDADSVKGARQDSRVALEAMVREAYRTPSQPFPFEEFAALQDACRQELTAMGNPWIVSDFISLGSPLTHAEFLLAKDRASLERNKERRILPTCPPTLEFDRNTKRLHFTYRARGVTGGDASDASAPRVPHHAALFAYTRWTNIFSPLVGVLVGDIVSGPVGGQFGLRRADGSVLSGIRDIAVLPCAVDAECPTRADRQRRLLTHLRYWNDAYARGRDDATAPFHIRALRSALDLGRLRPRHPTAPAPGPASAAAPKKATKGKGAKTPEDGRLTA